VVIEDDGSGRVAGGAVGSDIDAFTAWFVDVGDVVREAVAGETAVTDGLYGV
jgi:hypothetical protein